MMQSQGSPVAPVYSNASSPSDPTTPWVASEELDSGINKACTGGENFMMISVYLSKLSMQLAC